MHRPAYWQLDLFMGVMIGLAVAMMRANVSSRWETGAEIAWAVLMVVGMAVWLWANWAALQREEHAVRIGRDRCRPAMTDRTIRLTPVQEHFLAVMAQIDTDDPIVVRSEQAND